MSRERHERVAGLFLAAADLPPEERSRYLDDACGEDLELRRDLEELLERDARSAVVDRGLAPPSLTLPVSAGSSAARTLAAGHDKSDRKGMTGAPHFIGEYEILGLLGQGGMGAVYRARQASPSRVVALKIIHPGLLTPALLRRFEFEAQILAELQHPGIGQVFEAGTAEIHGQRLPYFAMELIEGPPLTKFADEAKLDSHQRLRLLQRVCDAVQHAHQKGVIHRDLKPANILVVEEGTAARRHGGTRVGEKGAALRASPKILDFGIARATAPDLRSATLETQPGQLIGTLPYMSPEQLAGNPRSIDVRSDVYALGVITYELLSGRLPHDLRGTSLVDAVRIRTNSDPPPLGRLDRRFRGDIETIVARAMDRDPARRYASAAELGREIERFLAGEAIEARRDSRMYVLRKTLARHRGPVIAGCILLLTLAAASAISIGFALSEARQRKIAELSKEQTEQVTKFQSQMFQGIDVESMGRNMTRHVREQAAAALARKPIGQWPERRTRSAAEIGEALAKFDESLAGVEGADVARRVLDENLLGAAARTLDDRKDHPPLVRAQLLVALGSAYRALALYETAERHLRAALDLRITELGRDHPDVADSLAELGMSLQEAGDPAAAEPLYREALEIGRRQRGPDDPRTVVMLTHLASTLKARADYSTAESMYQEALDLLRARFGSQHVQIAGVLDNLGVLHRDRGNFAPAEAAHREAREIRRALGTVSVENAITLNNLARVLSDTGRFGEAETLQRESLNLFERELGHEHPHTLIGLRNLAETLQAAGKPAEAGALQLRAIELGRRLYGDDDPELVRNLSGLGIALQSRGELDKAEPLLREALKIVQSQPSVQPDIIGRVLNNLAALLHARRQYSEAEPLYRESLAVMREALGPDHPDISQMCNNLAAMLRDKGDFDAAEPVYREAVRLLRLSDAENPTLGISLAGLGRVLAGKGDHPAAEPVYLEAAGILASQPDANCERIVLNQTCLATTLVASGRFAEAERQLLAAEASLARCEISKQRALTSVLEGFISLYDRWESVVPNEGYGHRATEHRTRLAELRK